MTTPADQPSYRTGPIGRAGRLAIAIISAYALLDIVDGDGVIGFRRLAIAEEPGVWLMTVLMAGAFFALVEALSRAFGVDAGRYRVRTAIAAMTVVLGAGGVSVATSGAVWGFPLSDLVWTFNVVMLSQTVVASLIAITLGTPGCEVGVWTELIARARYGEAAHVSGPACVLGLHFVDAWEVRRRRQI